ncbi:MAG TPA: fibronectin type III domain-containing protein [Spirochaetia bacterium]|nr:fibronectin type III domain-containing protein [Spirochaetia bacterium]
MRRAALFALGAAAAALVFLTACARDLAQVQSVSATPNGTSLIVTWQAVPGATDYDLYFSSSPNVSPTSYSQDVTATTTTATVSGLTVGATYYLVVAASTLYGFSLGPASEVVAVDLTGAPANPAPVITEIGASPEVPKAGTSVQFAATASDTDGDTLTYTWAVDGATVAGPTANLNIYYWTASGTSGSSHTVQVTVSDGTTTVSAQTSCTIQ